MRFTPARAAGGLARRVGQTVLTLLGTSLLVWALLPLTPGDPGRRYLEVQHVTAPTPAAVQRARQDLGLDRPWIVPYTSWLRQVAWGDLANSYTSGLPVRQELSGRVAATLRLALAAVVLGLVLAIPVGLLGALFAGRWPDALARLGATMAAATPSFVIGLALLYIVVLRFGIGTVISGGRWNDVLMPALAIAPLAAARWSRLLRAGLLTALDSEYARVSRARGATRLHVAVTHALPNAAIPLRTAVSLTAGYLAGGDVVVETVFSWPGVGHYVAQSVANRDLPVIQAYALIVTVVWVTLSLLVDVLAGVVDPRTRKWSRR